MLNKMRCDSLTCDIKDYILFCILDMQLDFRKSVEYYADFVVKTRMWVYRPKAYDELIDPEQFYRNFYDGNIEFTVCMNGVVATFFGKYDRNGIVLRDNTPKELLDLYGVRKEAKKRLTGTAFKSIKEWTVVCLYQWSDVAFDEFASECIEFDPYRKLGGNGQNLYEFMQAEKRVYVANE